MKEKIRKLYVYIERNVWSQAVLLLIVVLFALLEIQAISEEIRNLKQENYSESSILWQNRDIRTLSLQPEDIEAWMTFSYINTVFDLPSDYLEKVLGVREDNYPYISIARFARRHHLASDQFLFFIQNVVADYSK